MRKSAKLKVLVPVLAALLVLPGTPLFAQTPAGGTVTAGGADQAASLPRSFRGLSLGMGLDDLKAVLAADALFAFRGDPDVSFLPRREETLVETAGLAFVRRAFFQLREGAVFIMAFTLDTVLVDHYSVYTALARKYGEPRILNPREAVWESGNTRVSVERPLTVKYIDLDVFNRLAAESRTETQAEIGRRQEFLNEF